MHYEGGGFTTPATDIICPMYARVAQIQAFAAAAPEWERRPGVNGHGIVKLQCNPLTVESICCAISQLRQTAGVSSLSAVLLPRAISLQLFG